MKLEDLLHQAEHEAEDWGEFTLVIEMNGVRVDVSSLEFVINEEEGLLILS
jgi:hypothetical protein